MLSSTAVALAGRAKVAERQELRTAAAALVDVGKSTFGAIPTVVRRGTGQEATRQFATG